MRREADDLARSESAEVPPLARVDLEVTNPNLLAMPLARVPALAGSGIVVSRIWQDGRLQVPRPETRLGPGDVLLAVGLGAGDVFVETLVRGDGLYRMACGAALTVVPLLIGAVVARLVLGLNYLTLCGVLAGAMTDPPALSFATAVSGSEAPWHTRPSIRSA